MEAVLLLLLLSCLCSNATAGSNYSLHIIVVFPSAPGTCSDGTPLWIQGEDNLQPTVDKVVSDINNSPDILLDYEIVAIPICVSHSDPNKAVVEFVRVLSESYNKSKNIVGVVGLFDNIFANTILPVIGHEGIELIQLIDSTALVIDGDNEYRYLYTLMPTLETETRASLSLLLALNWTKIGLIYNSSFHDTLYIGAVETFLVHSKALDRPISVSLINIQNQTSRSIVNRIKQFSDVRIYLTLLPPQMLPELLCAVYQAGLLWPEYAWITFADGELKDIIATHTCTNKQRLIEAMENTIVVNSSGTTTQFDLDCNKNIDMPQETPQANSLYDSIWALSLALNTSVDTLHKMNLSLGDYGPGKPLITKTVEQQLANISFCGSNGLVRIGAYPSKENDMVQITQIQSGHYEQIGIYDTQSQELNVSVSQLGKIPLLFPDVYDIFPQPLTVILSIIAGICFLFTTVVLLLFIYYRNEPEVKATSVWLSLCMFVGCYLMLTGALVHFIDSGVYSTSDIWRLADCNVTTFSTFIGVDLIIATLLAKVLRVWRIFAAFKKTGKAWNDQVLLLFIGLIISVKFFLLVIWLAVDTYTLSDVIVGIHRETRFGSSYKIAQQCVSRMEAVWLAISFSYSGLLGLCLIAVSIKTRKIKRGNFKDTKKINILVVIVIYMMCVFGALWGLLRVVGNITFSKALVGAVYCLVPLLCEIFLFFPKIIPPIQRQLRIGPAEDARSFVNPLFSQNSMKMLVNRYQSKKTLDTK